VLPGFRFVLLVLAVSVLPPVLAVSRAAVPASPAEDVQPAKPSDPEASKKDLLKRMEALEAKLPRELARKLIIISMKLTTGWCSPYETNEFETQVDKLPEQERKPFEKEWKVVREHEAWPSVIARKQAGASQSKK